MCQFLALAALVLDQSFAAMLRELPDLHKCYVISAFVVGFLLKDQNDDQHLNLVQERFNVLYDRRFRFHLQDRYLVLHAIRTSYLRLGQS